MVQEHCNLYYQQSADIAMSSVLVISRSSRENTTQILNEKKIFGMNWKGRTDPKKFVGISGSFTVLVYKTAKSTPAEIILARYIILKRGR